MESAPTDRIKLHLRRVEVESGGFSVLTPRPQSPYRVATRSYEHGSVIVTDQPGAWFFARLVWATAYQQRARTILLVDGASLRPDPSDGTASLPILLVNSELDGPTPDDCEQIRARLPLDAPRPGSVRLVTHGLDRALADPKHYLEEWRAETAGQGSRHRHAFTEVGGVLLFAAPPAVLRRWAFDAARMVAALEGAGTESDPGFTRAGKAERTESAELRVIPGLWADAVDAPGAPVVTPPGPPAAATPATTATPATSATPARRVLWEAPGDA